eukprot:CAMPEP_0198302956 /NCGR_PEP_ID=MMETSP1449-20131203/56636_1 /TAXON_ID=420275 /ORGANISM="Attheya septentrionalis, Strain CCMP2084" /LENGTH=483 /DNA_ID=CAMNT_0044005435 /DNA_START=73 /DNA_END=1524 /DNA_ORIENTATION=-
MTNEISSGAALSAPHLTSAFLARKRRMEALRKQRFEQSDSSDSESEPSSNKKAKMYAYPSAVSSPVVSDSSPQKEDSRKSRATRDTQVRYNPDVPMPKEELAEWRKEARRVRNRESAAASRQKTRSRIDELEGELNEWKAKYIYAMERIRKLENERKRDHVHTVDGPPHMVLDASPVSRGVVSPCESPVLSSKAISCAVIQSLPQLSSLFSNCQTEQEQGRSQSQGRKKKNEPHPTKHLNEMISRPKAKSPDHPTFYKLLHYCCKEATCYGCSPPPTTQIISFGMISDFFNACRMVFHINPHLRAHRSVPYHAVVVYPHKQLHEASPSNIEGSFLYHLLPAVKITGAEDAGSLLIQEQGRSQSQGRKRKNEPHPTKHLNEMISRPKAVKITGAEDAGSLLIPPYFGFFPPSAPESAAIENMLPEFILDSSENDSCDSDDHTRTAPIHSIDADTHSNDQDLEEFLLDALGEFDPTSAELIDVCV